MTAVNKILQLLRRSNVAAVITFLIISSPYFGCRAQKGYIGSRAQNSSVSLITFRTKNISVDNVQLDRRRLGILTQEIETLPGSRLAQASFTLNDTECPYYLPGCIDVSYRGDCEVTFQSLAGKGYIVEIEGIGKSAFITVKGTPERTVDNSNPPATTVGICRVTQRLARGKEYPKGGK